MAPPFRRSYAMHGAIAAGGMATVHVGRLLGPSGFARSVAIKRLHPQLAANADIASMFAEEARLSARVIHANVVPVLDVVYADGELLLVMEYVRGESLSRLLAHAHPGGHVPIPIVAAVLADLLHGLHAAHEAKGEDGAPLRLVHRDVSPQNVLVGTDGVARVVDFGIAKALGLAPVTRDGQLRGKIPYMAPEQLARRSIDRRVDVYAAGVVLWEALAGKRLFHADDDATLFSKVLEEVVPPPSRFHDSVPEGLDAVVLRAIERDPERRFADARAMALALDDVVTRASPLAVAEWVKNSAAPALAERDARIAEMERTDGAEGAEASLPAIRAPFASVFFQDAATRSGVTSPEVPSPASAKSEQASLAIPRSPRYRRFVLAGAAGLLLVAGLSLPFRLYHRAADATPPPAPSAPEDLSTADLPPPAVSFGEAAGSSAQAIQPPRSSAHGPAGQRLCKVFDPDRQIFVMRPMRVSRCP
jgi:serine/threonine protein kinase